MLLWARCGQPEVVYAVEKPLGQGGFASVWQVRVRGQGRKVALKVFDQPAGSNPGQRREREFRVKLERKGIEAIRRKVGRDWNLLGLVALRGGFFQIHQVDGTGAPIRGTNCRALEFELIPSSFEPLQQRIQKGRLSLPEAVFFFHDLVRIVGGLHDLDLVHRDLNPANIFVDDRLRVLLNDYGLCRVLPRGLTVTELARSSMQTVAGRGAEGFSLDPAADIDPLDVRRDVYGLGNILCFVLTGHPPEAAKKGGEWEGIPGEIQGVIEKAVIPLGEGRYGDVGGLWEAFWEGVRVVWARGREEAAARRVEAELKKRYAGEAERRRKEEEESRRKFEEETRRRVDGEVRGRLEKEYRRRGSGEARGEAPKAEAEARGERSRPGAGPGRIKVVLDPAGKITMALVWIPPGVFKMGSKGKGGDWDEKPVHEVEITKEYWMGETEVTQGQWEAVMGKNPSYFKGKDLPVEQVSWEDCQEFVRRLNERCREQVGGKEFGLPTEAEWEYACRAGTTTEWSFGDDESRLGEYAWYYGNSGWQTHPVGQKKPNPWGLYDMHGNVREWCQDWYGRYIEGRQVDPVGPKEGRLRVQRGESWFNNSRGTRSADRTWDDPTHRSDLVGLRLVLR